MQPIGVFDSGFGGLTVLKDIVNLMPQYDYMYLGDNARTPYGTRSFETVYQYTLECVTELFNRGCPLVILACNTASAKALRTIQQNDLQKLFPCKKVLGVIRPTTELLGTFTKTNKVGILATSGTVSSNSYVIEMEHFFPQVTVVQHACPMWVPIIENNEIETDGADYFIKKDIESLLQKDSKIDTVLLACTHYPLIEHKIKKHLPSGIKLITQGSIVAKSLEEYLRRHTEINSQLTTNRSLHFYTTDEVEGFQNKGAQFFGASFTAEKV